MPKVTYRGSIEELVGSSWEVPQTVLSAGQGSAWIESQARQAAAEAAAQAEAEQRQQALLAARLEAQRQAAEAEAATPAPTRDELKQELRDELDTLTRAVLTGAAAVEARESRIIELSDEWEQRNEALVANAEGVIEQATRQVEAAMATTQASSEQVQSELDSHRLAVRSLENELRETVSTLVGPKGEQGPQGLAGSGVAYVDDNPTRIDITSLGERFYGRAVVPGDLAFWRTPDSLRVFRTADGRAWQQIDEIVNRQELVSQPISVLDQSTKSTNIVTTVMSGGGGSGGEKLLVNRMNLGATYAVGDTSNWAGISDPLSGTVELELRALDGTYAGQSSAAIASFSWEALGDTWTAFALNGALSGIFTINLNLQRSPAVAPGAYTSPMPVGYNRLVVFAQPVLVLGAAADGTTRFSVAGSIEYNHESQGVVQLPGVRSIQPLWTWG
jgi:hypothetical protein